MKCEKIGMRSLLFTFDDLGIPTNVLAIDGNRNIYLIDTYLGPASMELVHEEIKNNFGEKPYVIILTHGHWDHIWGNCYFASPIIISHDNCVDYMERYAAMKLEKNKAWMKGSVELVYPNLTFSDKLVFADDKLELFYSPGHSDDCISIWDKQDSILFAGDNLERPLPYLYYQDLARYQETLEHYLELDCKHVIGGHTACEGNNLILDNLEYIRKVQAGDTEEYTQGEYKEIHEVNMESMKKMQEMKTWQD